MSEQAQQLIDSLKRETELARELTQILQRDHEAIVRQDIDALEANNREKEALVVQFQSVEVARRELAARLAADLGVDPSEPRVSQLAPRLGEYGPGLETAAETLRAALSGLSELIAVSRGFLEQSIVGVRGLLSLIQSLRAPDTGTYDASGRYAGPHTPPVAVRREV